ncbi:MAG TPA: acetylornithine deacetylase/succinyl-diaminopimelate desuccinylase family protein, partial [Rhizobiales bacterium]|nr:acetylornithine deacetylase/succinyl-diaminopimelate desuccinylase family protein [Hyphomicrobiales bacterium]
MSFDPGTIDDRRDDLVVLTQELVRIPTTNPPGENYQLIAEYLAKRLKKSGFDIKILRAVGTRGDSDKYPRVNIIARKEGSRPGPCVHFNSHTDVVEAGEGWTHDPFAGELIDGRIYGRGTCDMKGGLAASIIAVEALIEMWPDFPGAIEISGSVDEESGGYGGVAWLAEQGYFSKPRVDHVIIPEPLNKDRICLGHRGGWQAEIETKGRIAHGAMPFLGDCAVRHMGAVLEAFEQDLFPALAAKTTTMPVVPEGAKQSTMNINSIHGGQEEMQGDGLPAYCVPDSCRMVIDRRFLIEEDLQAVKDEVTGVMEKIKDQRADFNYEIRDLNEIIPTMTAKDAPVVGAVGDAIRQVLGKQAELVISPGSYDQKHISRIGK